MLIRGEGFNANFSECISGNKSGFIATSSMKNKYDSLITV